MVIGSSVSGVSDMRYGHRSRQNRGWRQIVFGGGGAGILISLFFALLPAFSQPILSTPFYWQYTAVNPINQVEVADVNHDGIDEFLLVSANTIALVEADGQETWSFTTPSPINNLATLNLHGDSAPQLEIALLTENEIVLLNSRGNLVWRKTKSDIITEIAVIDPAGNGQEELIITTLPNLLERLDENGDTVWQYPIADEQLIAGELYLTTFPSESAIFPNQIAVGYFLAQGFSEVTVLDSQGNQLWKDPLSGQVTAMSFVAFEEGTEGIAVATRFRSDRAFVNFYSAGTGKQLWFRTPNREITTMVVGKLKQGDRPETALMLGTNSGVFIAYNHIGRRLWDMKLSEQPNTQVVAISPAPASLRFDSRLAMAITTISTNSEVENSQTALFTHEQTPLEELFAQTNLSAPPQLTDINRDGFPELILLQSAMLTLLDPDIGVREVQAGNEYNLNSSPRFALVADLNQDRREELIIATSNGNIHYLENQYNFIRNRNLNLGSGITSMALLPNQGDRPPDIVIGYEDFSGDSHLAILSGFGQRINDLEMPASISNLLVTHLDEDESIEIIAGTENGDLLALNASDLSLQWQTSLNGAVQFVVNSELPDDNDLYVTVVDETIIYQISPSGVLLRQLNILASTNSNRQINALQAVPPQGPTLVGGANQAILMVALNNESLQWISANNSPAFNRERTLSGDPVFVINDGNAFLVGTNQNQFLRLSYDNELLWELNDVRDVGAVFWGDLDGDISPDLAVGDSKGDVRFFSENETTAWEQFNVGQEIFFIDTLASPDSLDDLALITTNGLVQQYRANRAPLLVKPQTSANEDGYNVSLLVNDQENDRIQVTLETFDPSSNRWLAAGSNLIEGQGTVNWSIDPALAADGLIYRFQYDAGSHQSTLGPFNGVPTIIPPTSTPIWVWALSGFLLVAIGGATAYQLRRSESALAWRIYRRTQTQPEQTLDILALAYRRTAGSSDFLLNLGNRARQAGDKLVAGLADGLFLLADRPTAAFGLINETLESAMQEKKNWDYLPLWQSSCQLGQMLLEAPSITELSLLHPQMGALLDQPRWGQDSLLAFEGILPILSALRDSERVDMAEDRLVYLHEAQGHIHQLQEEINRLPPRVSTQISRAICNRLDGMALAGIEELRGQVTLTVTLRTKRVVMQPAGTMVTLEISNVGRSPAEEVVVKLLENPAYERIPERVWVHYLLPGWSRRVNVPLKPLVADRFRVAFEISYSDRRGRRKTMRFGDMVHLIAPQRTFSLIDNPYLPGTPIRRHSDLFVGRTNLFQFIAENVTRRGQRNVLILVGQRRAGKTSALLRLDQQLPEQVVTAYIDCQSLGVAEGMPALLHDIAWFISDALATRGWELPVPPSDQWQNDPAGKFQRDFIPSALALMPKDTILLLVFDEFEALENLVNDGILPQTLFPYLRHLMQHLEGVSFIFAGARGLEDMSADYWSALFNIALYRQVGYLDDQSAIRLITEPVEPDLIYDDLALDKILRVTAGHPYFLQLVCYTLVNRANQEQTGYITINDVNEGLAEMLRLGEAHFAYLWQRSTQTERALLTAIAHLIDRDLPFRPEELVSHLSEYGIQLTPAETISALNRLVEREILAEIVNEANTLYELKIGLVGLWVAGNKSLSKLYEDGQLAGEQAR